MCLTLVTQYSSFNFLIFSYVAGPSFRLGETSHFWIHVTVYFQNTGFQNLGFLSREGRQDRRGLEDRVLGVERVDIIPHRSRKDS